MAITKTTFKNRGQWERYRTGSLLMGSSDIGTILGLNPYKTPYQYWREKKSSETPQISSELHMVRGQAKEGAIVQIFEFLTGEKVIKRSAEIEVYTNDQLKHYVQAANDREVFAKDRGYRAILEVKDTKLSISQQDLDYPAESEYKILSMWYTQLQFQMLVGDWKGGYLVIENGQKEYPYKFYEFDQEYAMWAYNKATEWFEKYILGDDIPEPETADDTILAFPEHKEGKAIELDWNQAKPYRDLVEIKRKIKALEEEKTELEDEIKREIKDAELVHWVGKPLATWRTCKTRRIDLDSLRKDNPEIVEKYETITTHRKFLLK